MKSLFINTDEQHMAVCVIVNDPKVLRSEDISYDYTFSKSVYT